MADVIFQEGKCLKQNIIDKMIELMTGAGWKNISSKYDTDFIVMNSKGESNDKNLLLQFRYGSTTNASPINTTVATIASYRLMDKYTPSLTENTAGVFGRPTETWKYFYIAPIASLALDVELTYRYHVNKNRLIFIIETPESLNLMPIMYYMGLPDNHYTSEPDSRGVIAMCNYYGAYVNSVHICDAVAELPSVTLSSSRLNYCSLPPKSPNSAGIHTPVECMYGDTYEGYRGKIDGVFFLPNNSINNGDYLTLGSKRFRAIQLAVGSSNSYPSNTTIIQVS